MALEKTLESPLDCKEIKPVNPKGNQSWIFTGRTDAETPILWPPDVKNWLRGKDPDSGKDWRWEEKGMTENEMVGWHRWLNGHEFEQAPGFADGQGCLACCSPWGCRVRHNWVTELNWKLWSSGCYHLPRWLLRNWGNARSKWNKETGLVPDSRGAYSGMNSVSPEASIFPYIEC